MLVKYTELHVNIVNIYGKLHLIKLIRTVKYILYYSYYVLKPHLILCCFVRFAILKMSLSIVSVQP